MDTPDLQRRYFTVLDEAGRAMPAVEYWAGSLDCDEPVFEVVPLRRFVKLIGSGERLKELDGHSFTGLESGRSYWRLEPNTELGT